MNAPPHPELLRSLGRLVRGLSALFWGLPLALIIGVGTASAGWFKAYGLLPVIMTTGLLLFGLLQLDSFQKQERPWRAILGRAQFLALINCGLSPFLYWWHNRPDQVFFGLMVGALAFSSLLFLFVLNLVLLRLGAMLPDEALRSEIRQYTSLNRNLLITLITIIATYLIFTRVIIHFFPQIPHLPEHIDIFALRIPIPSLGIELISGWLILLMVCFLVLLPLSMTMALIWKTKEVILENVFGGGNHA